MSRRHAHARFSLRLLEAGANIAAMAQGACLDPDTAANYASRSLDDAERQQLEAHIDGCPACRELVSLVAKAAWSQAGDSPADAEIWSDVLPRGTRVGPYELRQPLSAGGMGVVYVAWDARLDRLVALKGVRAGRGDPARLLDEAKLMAQLAHPNVVPVYDVERLGEQSFIAMELVVGQTLRQWLERERRGWKEIVDAFLQAGAGLAAAHAIGIVHGDVKPANLLVGDDRRVRVTDFGLSRWAWVPGASAAGTPAYFAPEQRAGAVASAASDQYAFCVTLHEALFGALPGKPGVSGRRVPRALERLLAQGLAEHPAQRFESMGALLGQLRRVRLRDARALVGAVVAGTVLAAAAFALGGQRVEQRRCAAMAAALAPVWTADARGRVHDAFRRTGVSWADETFARVDGALTAWQTGFEAERAATCEGGGVPAPEQERRLACLADAARDASALLTQLLDADQALLVRAVGAAQGVPLADSCAVPPAGPQPAPRSEAIEAVRQQLAAARASAFAGRYRQALEQAERADVAARAVNEPHLVASARALLGGHRALLEPNDTAARTLTEAIALAELAGEERARAFAWAELLALEYARGRHAQVELLAPVALAAAERIHDLRLATDVQQTLGSSLSELGKSKEALAVLAEAVARRVKAWGADDRRTAAALSTLANAQAMAGELRAAAEAHQRALAAAKVGYGPGHPETAIIQQNLGDDFLYGLEGEPAVRELSQSVAVLQAAKGPRAREVALGKTDLGFALLLVDRVNEAAAAFDEAVAIFGEAAPQHPTLALALLGRAQVAQRRGAPPDVAELERAASLAAELPPFERGRVLLALGLHTGDASLVKQAREGLAAVELPLIVKARGEADAWLARQPK